MKRKECLCLNEMKKTTIGGRPSGKNFCVVREQQKSVREVFQQKLQRLWQTRRLEIRLLRAACK